MESPSLCDLVIFFLKHTGFFLVLNQRRRLVETLFHEPRSPEHHNSFGTLLFRHLIFSVASIVA